MNYHFRSKHIHVLWGRGFTVHVSAECGPQSETGYSQSKLTIHLPVNTPFRYFIVRGHTPSLLTAVTMCVTETQMNTRKPNKIYMLTQCTSTNATAKEFLNSILVDFTACFTGFFGKTFYCERFCRYGKVYRK